ncbi:unnamed protein product [Protopolystoma xenopodis]|uniref:Uncharacterized protein n=1 Tax=Protopolystoma xenopodis TaxID=117903 RepID=A0A448WGE0_9PLAT|nr:unnamed protein product [Protopolystoma xenopodis]
MTDDLLDKFEVVADESGQEFVKLVFTDDNNEPTGYALVTPEDAKKILSGEATLQSTVDSEGKQIITLAPVIQSDQPKPNEDSNLDGVLAVDNLDEAIESDSKQDMLSPIKQASKDVPRSETNLISMGPSAGVDNQDAAPEGVEQYTISEETVIINGIHMQLVTLIDSQGNVIDQKRGRPGEEVAIEMHGQAFMYQMQGPLEGGEQLTSTLYVSSGEPDDQVPADVTQHTPEGWSDLKDSTDDIGVPTHPIPEGDPASVAEAAGQQYTLTEAMAIVDGEAMQTVILEDSQGNVLDQKQGRRGDRAMISIHGHSLEYVFLGPTETGEAITTTLVVTTDSDIGPDSESALSSLDAPATALGAPRTEVSEAETPSGAAASTWVPAGLDVNFYTALRRQVEAMVSNRFSRPDAPVYAPEHVYHPRLGSRQAHLEMLQLVASYRPGLANRESLERYEVLRGYARIYRPSGPHSRALTRNEVCRFY